MRQYVDTPSFLIVFFNSKFPKRIIIFRDVQQIEKNASFAVERREKYIPLKIAFAALCVLVWSCK